VKDRSLCPHCGCQLVRYEFGSKHYLRCPHFVEDGDSHLFVTWDDELWDGSHNKPHDKMFEGNTWD